jgi:hypothetical protein
MLDVSVDLEKEPDMAQALTFRPANSSLRAALSACSCSTCEGAKATFVPVLFANASAKCVASPVELASTGTFVVG